MGKITAYVVLSECGSDRLCHVVGNAIRDGWEPQGGVTTSMVKKAGSVVTYTLFHQALVRREEHGPN